MKTQFDLQRFANISNSTANKLLTGTSYADSIYNGGSYSTLNGGDGDDTLDNYGSYSMLNGGSGSNNFCNRTGGWNTTMVGGAGNDSIRNYSASVSIVGGGGNDTISDFGWGTQTINGGAGDDLIYGDTIGHVYQFGIGDGNDTIYGFNENDTIQFHGGTFYYNDAVDNDKLISAYNGCSILLKDAANVSFMAIAGYDIPGIYNGYNSVAVSGTSSAEYINNWARYATINAGAGNDTIYSGWTASMSAVNGGNGNDLLFVSSGYETVDGGKGNDTIYSHIAAYKGGRVYKFNASGGSDVVIGYAATDTIRITDGSGYQTLTSGDDVIVSVGSARMTLKDAADTVLNISGGTYVDGRPDNVPSDASYYGGHYYRLYNDVNTTWSEAEAYAESLGGHLAIITSAGEQSFIEQLLSSGATKYHYWLGARRDSLGGTFYWIDGSPLTYTNWYSGEPNNKDGEENALHIYTLYNTLGRWNDAGEDVSSISGDDWHTSNFGVIVEWEDGSLQNTITNSTASVLISGKGIHDVIINSGASATLDAGYGDDTLSNSGKKARMSGGEGNDSLVNTASSASINAGDGNDTIRNSGASAKLLGGAGKDTIINSAAKVTLTGGKGNDLLSLGASSSNNLISYASGDGNDVIRGFDLDDTLKITSGSISSASQSGNNYIITVTKNSTSGKITLVGAGGYQLNQSGNIITLEDVPIINYINNGEDDILVKGTSDDDFITNTGENVTIQAGKGNDTIEGDEDYGDFYLFAYNSGRNVITNFGINDTLKATSGSISTSKSGNDVIVSITKSSSVSTITLTGTGSKTFRKNGAYLMIDDVNPIENDESNTLISGTNARDLISNSGANVTIEGLGGNDTIETCDFAEMICFASDGGNDVITNFGANDTLRITSGEIQSTVVSGGNVVVNVKSGNYASAITLGGAASLSSILAQNGEFLYADPINYVVNRTKKKKITGTGGRDYITNSASSVTIQPGKGNDTIEGSNYGELYRFAQTDGNNVITNFGRNDTLTATSGTLSTSIKGDDVIVSIKKSSTTATVTLKNTADYIFNRNGNTLTAEDIIVITESKNNAKITGTSGRDLITSTGENVTIESKGGNDTITGSDTFGEMYLFAYSHGDNVITNFGKNDTLKSTSGTLSYQKSGEDAVVSITKSGKTATITLEGAGNYAFNQSGSVLKVYPYNVLTNDDDNVKVVGTSEADSIFNTGANVTIQSNKGNDTITGSDYGEWFRFAYTHGKNVITNFGLNDTLEATNGTLKYAKSKGDMIVSISGANSSTTATVTLKGAGDYDFVKSGNILTINNVETLENDDDDVKFAGTNNGDWMINNGERVTIQGNGGDDTIEASGNGSQLFRFGAADGNDVIYNFGKSDTLKITSGSITDYRSSGGDYVIEVKNGTTYTGTVTLKNVSAIKVSGKNVTATKIGNAAQLPADYWFEIDSAKDELDDLISDAMIDHSIGMLERDNSISLASARSDQIATALERHRLQQ